MGKGWGLPAERLVKRKMLWRRDEPFLGVT